MARPRPVLDPKHAKRIQKAQRTKDKAHAELKAAVLDALADGASYLAIQDASGLAATTISAWSKEAAKN